MISVRAARVLVVLGSAALYWVYFGVFTLGLWLIVGKDGTTFAAMWWCSVVLALFLGLMTNSTTTLAQGLRRHINEEVSDE